MNAKKVLTLVVISFFLLAFYLQTFIKVTPALAQDGREGLCPELAEQLSGIIREKHELTPAQKKIDHNIRGAIKRTRDRLSKKQMEGQAKLEAIPSLFSDIGDSDIIKVTLKVQSQNPDVLAELENLGMQIDINLPRYGIIEGSLHLDQVEAVANLDYVLNMGLPCSAIYNTGDVTSAGDTVLLAADARTAFSVNGSGVKVGVMSNGVKHWEASVASGDLPSSVDVIKNGNYDEGTAMLEIIHDLAPGASLAFYCPSSSADMVTGIGELADAGCNVIVDDITYFDEPKFEDGLIAQEALDFFNNGGIYVTSAGNSAQRHYSSTYNRSTDNITIDEQEYHAHDYDGMGDIGNTFSVNAGYAIITILQWNDEWGSSNNDFDLYLLHQSDNAVLSSSTNTQSGSGNPWEGLAWVNTTGDAVSVYLAVIENNLVSPPSSMVLDYIAYYSSGLEYVVPEGSVIGHEAVTEVLSTAAAPAANPDTIEPFSSRGPGTIYFQDGLPSYEARHLPNITGVDGVQTKTGQLGYFSNPFLGTSAAAPHIAAIAALIWSANPSLSQSEVFSAITATAVDRPPSGWDGTWGFGRADAYAAVNAVIPPTVTGISPDSGDPGDTLTGVQITGTDFQDGAIVSFSGTGVIASNVNVVSSTNITADVTILEGASAGARDVIVNQGLVSGEGVGLFTVNALITVTAPSTIDLGLMAAGVLNSGYSATPGTVSTNAESWKVTAKDENINDPGYMVKDGVTPMVEKFQISTDNTTYEQADTGIIYESVTNLPFYVRQEVSQSDPGGTYAIIITFTSSIP